MAIESCLNCNTRNRLTIFKFAQKVFRYFTKIKKCKPRSPTFRAKSAHPAQTHTLLQYPDQNYKNLAKICKFFLKHFFFVDIRTWCD